MTRRKRVLVVGNGYVGSRLASALLGEGHETYVLTRRSPVREGEAIYADLTVPESLTGLPEELDALVYLVAPDGREPDAYERAFGHGLDTLLDALGSRLDRMRFLFTSSTAVYGNTDGGWVDESSPTSSAGFRASSLLAAESRLRDLGDSVAIRLAGIYGPGRLPLLGRLRQGNPGSQPEVYANRIHVSDVVAAYLHLLHAASPRPLYLGVDCEPTLRADMLRWLARTYSLPLQEADAGSELGIVRRSNKRCSNRLLIQSGYRFLYPSFREGYLATLSLDEASSAPPT